MTTDARLDRRGFLGAVAITALGGSGALAQVSSEKKVDPLLLPLDKPDVWTLHFRYRAPRITTLKAFAPGGRLVEKNVWYMWYQVYNKSGEPQTCLPEFELVTKDLGTVHLDEPDPFLVKQLNKIENPTGEERLKIYSSIGISKRPIPPSLPDAIPRTVSGVAIWTDLDKKAPKTNKFSIYISGLSNGLAVEDSPTGEQLIKRKTLQIDFLRPTDDKNPQPGDIVPDDLNGPAERWIYRTSSAVKPKGGN